MITDKIKITLSEIDDNTIKSLRQLVNEIDIEEIRQSEISDKLKDELLHKLRNTDYEYDGEIKGMPIMDIISGKKYDLPDEVKLSQKKIREIKPFAFAINEFLNKIDESKTNA